MSPLLFLVVLFFLGAMAVAAQHSPNLLRNTDNVVNSVVVLHIPYLNHFCNFKVENGFVTPLMPML